MATETVPMDDKELFSAATAEEAPAVVETPEPAAEADVTTEQPRDEHGRFAPKTAETPADAAPTQQQEAVTTEKPDEAQVPSWRLRELREERDALARRAEENERQAAAYQQHLAAMQRQMAELQKPKQEPVDFFADPDKAFKQQVSPIEDRISQLESNFTMRISRATAVAEHGKEAVAEMEKAVADAMRNNDPGINTLRSQLASSSDPVGTAMEWHASTKVIRETGGNIAAYKEKLLAEAMKDPAFQAKVIEAARGQANPGTRPNIQLPPSLNRTAGSGVTASELESEDMSDRSLFRYAANSR